MPVTRIAIREGKSPEYKQALMDEIYEAMLETVAIKEGDRFMAITEHGERRVRLRTVSWDRPKRRSGADSGVLGTGQDRDAKLAMYRRIVERLTEDPGVRPEDILISVVETAAENWSFGNGETQFYKRSDRDAAPA